MAEDFINLSDNVLWRRALKYYEQCDFFMAHEALEVLWQRSEGTNARFYQAFLQASVSLYHYGNANFAGARQLARSAISQLASLPDGFHGLDIPSYLREYKTLMDPLLANAPGLKPWDGRLAPPIRHL